MDRSVSRSKSRTQFASALRLKKLTRGIQSPADGIEPPNDSLTRDDNFEVLALFSTLEPSIRRSVLNSPLRTQEEVFHKVTPRRGPTTTQQWSRLIKSGKPY